MTKISSCTSRRFFLLLLAGAGIGALPFGFGNEPGTGRMTFGAPFAMANDGQQNTEQDSPEDQDDDSGGGSGSGGDSGGDSASDDNSGDGGGDTSGSGGGDTSGSGGGDTSGSGGGEDNGGGSNSGGGDDGSSHGGDAGGATSTDGGSISTGNGSGRNQLRNVTVRYGDGWVELILNDQYQLIDNLNRQVILRPATIEDFNRMVTLGS